MKISYNWLRDYVDVKNSAKAAAQWLTMAGLEVNSIEEKGKDFILETEVTTNRPDWLSVIGVARELSALTGKHLKMPKVPPLLPVSVRDKSVALNIQDKVLCPRYVARIIDGAKVGPSPAWLKERLEVIGVRPINNIVDITNFCLFELGQPLHAFDYDKLAGREIVVRRAKKGESIITIDNVKRELDSDMLIIADEKRPIAIAGVMGGIDTEVTESTRTILLESAYFDPASVRKTQRKLSLPTDSSYRFERGVDQECILFASNRAAKMMADICGGKIGPIKDAGLKSVKPGAVKVSVNRINEILDLDLTPVAVKKILVSLGLKVSGAQEELVIGVPSFRRELKKEEDIVEEVARIYGYDKIPATVPSIVGHLERKALKRNIEESARDILLAQGLDEVITYSLVDKKDLVNAASFDETKTVHIQNPLSAQQEVMRSTLIPGVLGAARFNINRKSEGIEIFELSRVYSKTGERNYTEKTGLCILISGTVKRGSRQKAKADLFDLKGIVENLFDGLGIAGYEFTAGHGGIFCPGAAARITVDGDEVGLMGEVSRAALEKFDIKKEIFLCEIDFEKFFGHISAEKRFSALPKFLPVKRDISLVTQKDIPVKELIDTVRENAPAILRDAFLSDEYFGAQIPTGKRGLTISIEYLSQDRQLTESEIEEAHNGIKQALVKKFGAAIR